MRPALFYGTMLFISIYIYIYLNYAPIQTKNFITKTVDSIEHKDDDHERYIDHADRGNNLLYWGHDRVGDLIHEDADGARTGQP